MINSILAEINNYKISFADFEQNFLPYINEILVKYNKLYPESYRTKKEEQEFKDAKKYITNYTLAINQLCNKYDEIKDFIKSNNLSDNIFQEPNPEKYRLHRQIT